MGAKGYSGFLREQGLLNEEWSYEDLVATQKQNKRVGFCSSRRCHTKINGGTPKFEAKGRECPDCGHALLWKALTYEQFENLKERVEGIK